MRNRSAGTTTMLFGLSLRTGGAERQMLHLLRHWPEPDAVAALLVEEDGAWRSVVADDPRVRFLGGPMPAAIPARMWWFVKSVVACRRVIRTVRPRVVVAFLWMPAVVAATATLGLRGRPELVWSVQSDLENDPIVSRRRVRRLAIRSIVRPRLAKYVAISRGIRDDLVRHLGAAEGSVELIPNAVDVEELRSVVPAPGGSGSFRICTIARLHPQKALDVLLDALARLPKDLPWEADVIGTGDQRADLERRSRELRISDKVRFLGSVPDPFPTLAAADVFVLSSSWEPFGIAIVEAMALGRPVVSTDTAGARDIISDGRDGVIVPVGSSESLAAAILDLANDAARRSGFGRRASEAAAAYDARAIARRYAALATEVVRAG